jgi:hypothetical protein
MFVTASGRYFQDPLVLISSGSRFRHSVLCWSPGQR